MTNQEENAIGAAQDYLANEPFSRSGLIEQLSSAYGDGYSKKDATYAVDSLHTNYDEQATKAAENYLADGHFSHTGLVQQLDSSYGDGYTHSQAEYGADHADGTTQKPANDGVTAQEKNAIGAAQDYLANEPFSRSGLIDQLSSSAGDGYSKKDATYAVDSLHTDYNKQAVKAAKSYLANGHFSHTDLVQQLESGYGDGYTHSQAEYGADHAE